ncbi:MAG: ammonium transporter [Planctomycetota bacterium]|nr:MAG: ammonium transporter [Planctomycetota bacterium]
MPAGIMPCMEHTLSVDELAELLQILWTIIAAALVLFMQAGFCALEAGTVRSKNSINVAIKNIMDMCCSIAGYFMIGYALMFGLSAESIGIIGTPALLLEGVGRREMLDFLFQATFCATAATIVSGAIAERCRFFPYLLMALGIAVFIYPVYGHWVWGGGWLERLGFHDFAGSAVVHGIGGAVALAGIQVLGPRHGRFDDHGTARPMTASSMPMVALGVVILTVGWMGFNGGSAELGVQTPTIVANTLIAACFGGLVALLVTWSFAGLASVEMILNGVLGGLVAITAGADVMQPVSSMVIGMLGGGVVVLATVSLQRLRLDDVVGAVPVHLGGGIVGVLAVALFCPVAEVPEDLGRSGFFLVQLLGTAVCVAWGWGMGWLLWLIIGWITPLRTGPGEEQVGLNFSEHRVRDSFAELSQLMAASARGEPVSDRLRELEDGEAASFGMAVAKALHDHEHSRLFRLDLADRLAYLAREIEESGVSSGEMAVITSRMTDLSDFIQRIQHYLSDHRQESSAIPVLIDLLQRLDDQLQECQQCLPDNRNQPLAKVVERLHSLAERSRRGLQQGAST